MSPQGKPRSRWLPADFSQTPEERDNKILHTLPQNRSELFNSFSEVGHYYPTIEYKHEALGARKTANKGGLLTTTKKLKRVWYLMNTKPLYL